MVTLPYHFLINFSITVECNLYHKGFTFQKKNSYRGSFLISVPSQPPRNFSVTVSSSTSVTASWKLPSVESRHGIVLGFKLYYKKTGSSGLPNTLTIRNESVGTVEFTGLDKYTEYEFQVLAFTSAGDGPKSSAEVARTKEDGKKCKPIRI